MRQSELRWKRLKHVTAIKGGAGFPHEEQGLQAEELPFFKVASLEGADSEGGLTAPDHRISRETAKRLGAHVFPPGTVVFAKVGAALLLNRFRQLIAEACLDNNMMGLEPFPEQVLPRFLMYSMSTKDLGLIANPGAVPSVNGSQIAEEKIWCPSLNEQERIANFLDYKTARIDALIAEKESLKELLELHWQATLAETFQTSACLHSGGLASGWRFLQLKRVCRSIQTGRTPSGSRDDCFTDEGFPWITPGDLRNGLFATTSSRMVADVALEEGEVIAYPAGATLLIGIGATVGTVAHATVSTSANQQINILVPDEELVDPVFLTICLLAHKEQIKLAAGAATLPIINQEKTGRLIIAIPRLAEQVKLRKELLSLRGKFDLLFEHTNEHISRLREYRSALISAAVTGELDVGTFKEAA